MIEVRDEVGETLGRVESGEVSGVLESFEEEGMGEDSRGGT